MKTITVRELRDLLDDYDDDTPVIFSSNYGDRGRTEQAHALSGDADLVTLRKSGYSESGYAVVEDDEDAQAAAERDDDSQEYLRLS